MTTLVAHRRTESSVHSCMEKGCWAINADLSFSHLYTHAQILMPLFTWMGRWV